MPSDFSSALILAFPVASVAWVVTHEEIFREQCATRSRTASSLLQRKFFYVFTCEFCFSHWVTIALLVITRFQLLYADWRGYLVSGFTLVWIANGYMAIYARLRLDLKSEQLQIKTLEAEVAAIETKNTP